MTYCRYRAGLFLLYFPNIYFSRLNDIKDKTSHRELADHVARTELCANNPGFCDRQ